MRDLMTVAGRTVGEAGGAECVQRVPDTAVAERVHVYLESVPVECGDDLREVGGRDERQPEVAGLVPVAVEVRREHRRGERLADAVQHDLHGDRSEPAELAAAFPEPGDLLHALRTLPPLAADHARGEIAG